MLIIDKISPYENNPLLMMLERKLGSLGWQRETIVIVPDMQEFSRKHRSKCLES